MTKLASAGDDIKFWDTGNYLLIKEYNPHNENISDICWSHDNSFLASVAVNSDKIGIYSSKTTGVHVPINILNCQTGQLCVDLTSTSRYMVVGGSDSILNIYDLKTKSVKKTYKDHKGPVSCVMFNDNDSHIASGSESGEIIVYNVVTGQGCRPMMAPKVQAVRQLQFNSVKKSLLGSASEDGAVNLWDVNTRRLVHSFSKAHIASATGLKFSPLNDILLLSVGLDKRIVCFDVQSKKQVKSISVDCPLTSLDIKPDGVTVAAGSTRGKICIYDLRKADSPVNVLNAHKSSVQQLKFQINCGSDKIESHPTSSVKSTNHHINTETSPNRRQLPSAPTESKQNILKDVASWSMSTFLEYLEFDSSGDETDPIQDSAFTPIQGGHNVEQLAPSGPSSFISSRSSNESDGLFSPMRDPAETFGSSAMSPFYSVNLPNTVNTLTPENRYTGLQNNHNNNPGLGLSATGTAWVTHRETPNQPELNKHGSEQDRFVSPHEDWLNSSHHNVIDEPQNHMPVNDGSPNLPTASIHNSLHGAENSRLPTFSYSSVRTKNNVSLSQIPVMNKFDDSPSASAGAENLFSSQTIPSPEGAQSVPSTSGMRNIPSHQSEPSQHASAASQSQNFQTQVIRNLINEELEDFKDLIHKDILNLHVEMLKQFQIQMMELTKVFQQHSVNPDLLAEIERLKEENKRLKKNF